MRFLTFLIILLLWYLLSTYCYVCMFHNNDCSSFPFGTSKSQVEQPVKPAPTPTPTANWQVRDGNAIIVNAPDDFKFGLSSDAPIISNPVNAGLANLANYFKRNPGKLLNVSGKYAATEKNNTSFENLGLARADAIKQKLVALGVPASQIATKGILTPNLTFTNNELLGGVDWEVASNPAATAQTDTATKPAEPAKPVQPVVLIKDGTDVVLSSNEGFSFTNSQPGVSVKPELAKKLTNLVDYLKKNPDRQFTVTGRYAGSEKNNSKFPNLGLARADDIKQKLVARGIPANKILTDAKRVDDITFAKDNTFPNGADFGFSISKEVAKDLTIKPRTLYFATNNADLNITPELQKYFKDVKTYLAQDGTKKVSLTGHTDDVGAADANQKLGLRRANDVKNELQKIGIAVAKVITSSKGEVEPAKSNKTATGRQANRRVEMIIK